MSLTPNNVEVTNIEVAGPCLVCKARTNFPTLEDLAKDIAQLRSQVQSLQEAINRQPKVGTSIIPPVNQPSKDQEAQITTPRVKYITSKIDESGKRIETPGISPVPAITARLEPEFAFEAREFFDNKGKSTPQIILISPGLRELVYNVLKKHFEHSKDTQWAEREPSLSVLHAPFSPLLSYWKELNKEAQLSESNHAKAAVRDDLKILLQHVRDLQPESVLLTESIQDATRVTRQQLEILFRPGTLVVARTYFEQPQVFKVHSLTIQDDDDDDDDENDQDTEHTVIIKCWAYDWKGTKLERTYYNFRVKNFGEEKEIKDLPCYPVQYYEDANGNKGLDALKNEVIPRGKRFRKICTKSPGANSVCRYKGQAMLMERRRKLIFGPIKTDWATRESLSLEDIVVDFESFQQECNDLRPVGRLVAQHNDNPCNCLLCLDSNDQRWIRRFSLTGADDDDGADQVLDRNYLLLPPRVVGFAFKSGYFAQFLVNNVETRTNEHPELEFDDRLIFSDDQEENKVDIKRLIMGHKSDEGERTIGNRPLISDAVEGKGKGLVILLHGPPGVGKTMTAELGARAASRPLYKVGASDIGLNPEEAERSFTRMFNLASKWQAVLLIDEAEVFLDTRGPKGEGDIRKNALVSVLLRALEYFQGVLVMTTNRVMTLDPAMVSRIHYAVSLGPFDKDQEAKIWKSYTDQLNSNNCKDISEIKGWVEAKTKKKTSEMNGRQIRNLFTTAQALAEGALVEGGGDGTGKISLDHLQRVNETMMTFREDMHELLILARTDAAKS